VVRNRAVPEQLGGNGDGSGGGNGDKDGPGLGDGGGDGFAGLHGRNVTQPVLLSRKDPKYSEEARKAKFQGTVELSIVVNAPLTVRHSCLVAAEPAQYPAPVCLRLGGLGGYMSCAIYFP
jgi:hypothetical protein